MEQSYVYLVYKSSCSLSQFLLYGVPVLGVSVAGELCHCQGVVEGDGWFRPEVLHEPTRIQSFGIQNTYVHVHVLVLLHAIVHVRTCACMYYVVFSTSHVAMVTSSLVLQSCSRILQTRGSLLRCHLWWRALFGS